MECVCRKACNLTIILTHSPSSLGSSILSSSRSFPGVSVEACVLSRSSAVVQWVVRNLYFSFHPRCRLPPVHPAPMNKTTVMHLRDAGQQASLRASFPRTNYRVVHISPRLSLIPPSPPVFIHTAARILVEDFMTSNIPQSRVLDRNYTVR